MPKTTSKSSKSKRPGSGRRSGGGLSKLIEALITGLVVAVVAAALVWGLLALAGLDQTSWHAGLASGMAAGLAMAAAAGPTVRRTMKKLLT